MGRTVVIGGGAAGLAAAITAAEAGDSVMVLERMERVGKKLLATGNGRCNLMNLGAPIYPGGSDFAKTVLSHCGVAEQRAFWTRLGLRLRTEDGCRVYPVSGQASTVLDTLRLAMERNRVKVLTGIEVKTIELKELGFQITDINHQGYRADRVIVTCGGQAQPRLGSNGSGYGLLTALGHTVTPVAPALSQIMTDTRPVKGLSGIRVKAKVTVTRRHRMIHQESGEALFTDYGVSGVCVMQCSRFAREKDTVLSLDLSAGMGFEDAETVRSEILRRRSAWRKVPMEQLMTGLCLPRVASALCTYAGIAWKERLIGSLTAGEVDSLTHAITDFAMPVKGVKGFDSCQVTAGGITTTEFDANTMASRLVPGLYAAGEVLDVDGDCGGFNLMFAFGSGILAGANKKTEDKV